MKKILAILIAAGLAVVLSACDPSYPTDPIKQGKECHDAGGIWKWSDWDGYHCTFPFPKEQG